MSAIAPLISPSNEKSAEQASDVNHSSKQNNPSHSSHLTRSKDGNTAISTPPRSKRSRIAQACDSCRSRKTKCDGKYPRCSSCSYLELDCSFGRSNANIVDRKGKDSAVGRHLDASMESDLKAYIATLEKRLSQLERKFEGDPLASIELLPKKWDNRDQSTGAWSSDIHFQGGGEVENDYQTFKSQDMDDGEEDIGSNGNPIAAQKQEILFLGQSNAEESYASCPSTADFLSLVSKSIGMGGHLSSPSTSDTRVGGPASRLNLPTPQTALNLFDFFSQNTHQLYPFVDIQERREKYTNLYNASKTFIESKYPTAVAQRQMIFPLFFDLLLQFSSVISQLSLAFLHHLNWSSNLTKVQALLLCAHCYQSCGEVSKAWDVLGLAVHAACTINLHTSEPSILIGFRQKEIRNRTWAVIELSDLWFSIMLGRISITSLMKGRRLELRPLEGEDISILTHLRYSRLLTETLGNFIERPLRMPPAPTSNIMAQALNRLSMFEVRFEQWQKSMKSIAKEESSGGSPDIITVLNLRSCFIRQVAHLPILSMQLAAMRPEYQIKEGHNTLLPSLFHLQQTSLGALFDSSAKSIEHLLNSDAENSLSSGSFRVFYAFNSLVVLAALYISPTESALQFNKADLTGKSLSMELLRARSAIHRLALVRATQWADRALYMANAVLVKLGLMQHVNSNGDGESGKEEEDAPGGHVSVTDTVSGTNLDTLLDNSITSSLNSLANQQDNASTSHQISFDNIDSVFPFDATHEQDFDFLAWLNFIGSSEFDFSSRRNSNNVDATHTIRRTTQDNVAVNSEGSVDGAFTLAESTNSNQKAGTTDHVISPSSGVSSNFPVSNLWCNSVSRR